MTIQLDTVRKSFLGNIINAFLFFVPGKKILQNTKVVEITITIRFVEVVYFLDSISNSLAAGSDISKAVSEAEITG